MCIVLSYFIKRMAGNAGFLPTGILESPASLNQPVIVQQFNWKCRTVTGQR
jgi:hypothetical protein